MTSPVVTLYPERVKWTIPIPRTEALRELNERCIEVPLGLEVAALDTPGRVLDAGCALLPAVNLAKRSYGPVAELVHLTQNISSEVLVTRAHGSYLSADLRDLSLFADRAFDRVICLSTLEHVGLDNTSYGGPNESTPHSVRAAWQELWRVTKTVLFVTVPVYRAGGSNGRWRYLASSELDAQIAVLGATAETKYFTRDETGCWWGGADRPYPDPPTPPDKPQQIACVKLTR